MHRSNDGCIQITVLFKKYFYFIKNTNFDLNISLPILHNKFLLSFIHCS